MADTYTDEYEDTYGSADLGDAIPVGGIITITTAFPAPTITSRLELNNKYDPTTTFVTFIGERPIVEDSPGPVDDVIPANTLTPMTASVTFAGDQPEVITPGTKKTLIRAVRFIKRNA